MKEKAFINTEHFRYYFFFFFKQFHISFVLAYTTNLDLDTVLKQYDKSLHINCNKTKTLMLRKLYGLC